MKPNNRALFSYVKMKLGTVSDCFCLAKWNRTTLYLQNGTAHSCHLPAPHSIDVEAMRANPFALLNTPHVIQQRSKMMNGVRPEECSYCWWAEDSQTDGFSDRVLKSTTLSLREDIDSIKKDPLSLRHVPNVLEVSFSNKCQLKCSYCSAHSSSSWEQELKTFGAYSSGAGGYPDKSYQPGENEYLQTFWKLWPEIRGSLQQFRITGGEPLLSPITFRILEELVSNPQPRLELSINTNMCAPEKLMTQFISLCAQLAESKAVASVTVFTSIEAYNEKAEYIRNGLDARVFWKNLSLLASASPEINIKIMSTFNALCVTSFIPFLEQTKQFNEADIHKDRRAFPVYIEIAQLRTPDFQSVLVLEPEYQTQIGELLRYMEQQKRNAGNPFGSTDVQINMVRRILQWSQDGVSLEVKNKLQSDFYSFFSEHDQRRNTSLLGVFPELARQWDVCKDAYFASRQQGSPER